MSVAVILIWIFDTTFQAKIHDMIAGGNPKAMIFIVYLAIGLSLSIYHLFATRAKSLVEKRFMLFIALTANALGGIGGGIHGLRHSQGLLIVFPILNIVSGLSWPVLQKLGIIDETCIDDENAAVYPAVFGALLIGLLFCLLHFELKLFWATTLSICVVYATNVSSFVEKIFRPNSA